MFAALQEWVAAYYTRRDASSCAVRNRRNLRCAPGPEAGGALTLATLPE